MSDRAAIKKLEKTIGHQFRDRDLIERALTHASYGDGAGEIDNNERLEFLGDRVLGLLTAEKLHSVFKDVDEGQLAPRLNTLVRKETCARIARAAGLGEALRLSKSEEKSGGRDKVSILGDSAEALMGALYLDGGLEAARKFYETFWKDELKTVAGRPKDAKTRLQEWALTRGGEVPRYEIVGRSGPDHAPKFKVEVHVEGLKPASGKGGSRQLAERAAAEKMLKRETDQ